MTKKNILVVEDDESISELMAFNLRKEGHHVRVAENGKAALKALSEALPDLVLLDLMLPDLNGLEVCRQLKGQDTTRHVPVVIVSAKGEEADVVTGLELGADDYVVKPFSPAVLCARVRTVLRRKREQPQDATQPLVIKDLEVHPGRREVKLKGKFVELTFTEFEILHLLARRMGWAFTRQKMVDAIRGDDYPVTERAVDVQIVSLRRKLGTWGKNIETVRGIGYRMKEL